MPFFGPINETMPRQCFCITLLHPYWKLFAHVVHVSCEPWLHKKIACVLAFLRHARECVHMMFAKVAGVKGVEP